jgi:hypothetical protein
MAAFVSSYIPTTTAAATRAADVVSITGSAFSSWYRQDEGTIYVEGATRGSAATQVLFQVDNAATAERIAIRRTNTNNLQSLVVDNSATVYTSTITSPLFDENIAGRAAIAFATDNVINSFNGALGTLDTAATMPTVTQAVIGNGAGSAHANGAIRRIVFWPQALPSLLQSLTQ